MGRGDARLNSDFDIALSAKEPLPPDIIPRIKEYLQESRIPFKVDIVDLNATTPELKSAILKEGIEW